MFAKKTVDGVLDAMAKAVNELLLVEEYQINESKKAAQEVEEARARVHAANAEFERAQRVRQRLTELLS